MAGSEGRVLVTATAAAAADTSVARLQSMKSSYSFWV